MTAMQLPDRCGLQQWLCFTVTRMLQWCPLTPCRGTQLQEPCLDSDVFGSQELHMIVLLNPETHVL